MSSSMCCLEGSKPAHTVLDGGQPNAAVIYLTRNTPTRRVYLQSSLHYLFRAFNGRCGYPVLIFHEGDFSEDVILAIRRDVPGDLGSLIHFKTIDDCDFRYPASVDEEVVRVNQLIVPEARGLGYRTMCRWWIRHLPKYLSSYDLYMRLDDDSFIEEQLNYDPFRVVQNAGVDYASNLIHVEHPLNALGLESLSRYVLGENARMTSLFVRSETAEIIEPHKLAAFLLCVPAVLRNHVDIAELSAPIIYYNNFHIARTALWADPIINGYFEEIDRSTGIYHLRWGDAALHTIALVAAKDLALGRFNFCYSKRYEREQGSYVNTNHPTAKRYFDAEVTWSGANPKKHTGSMTDFKDFNDLLSIQGLGDLANILPNLQPNEGI